LVEWQVQTYNKKVNNSFIYVRAFVASFHENMQEIEHGTAWFHAKFKVFIWQKIKISICLL